MKKQLSLIILIVFCLIMLPFFLMAQDENSLIKDLANREMIKIDGGTYTQTSEKFDGSEHGSFRHTVSSFEIGQFEVTYLLWYTVYQWAISNGYSFANKGQEGTSGKEGAAPSNKKYEPVTVVSWRDCIVWCNAYSEMAGYTPVYKNINGDVLKNAKKENCDSPVVNWSGNGYRLPTEGEWQYAASNKGATPWDSLSGETNSIDKDSVAWYDANSNKTTHTVGTKTANELGLYDMSGNAWEWCWDWYGLYPTTTQTDYKGPKSGTHRVPRGGCWYNDAGRLRVGNRGIDTPKSRGIRLGFRVVRSLQPM